MTRLWVFLLVLSSVRALGGDMPYGHPRPQTDCPPINAFAGLIYFISSTSAALVSRAASRVSSELETLAARIPPRKLQVPKLLTKDFYLPEDICRDARANHPGKKFAFVAGKMHICDLESKVCLKLLRDISDPCNQFIQQNFAVYHTRAVWDGREIEGADELIKKWESPYGPRMSAIDLSSCKVFPSADTTKMYSASSNLPASERFHRMQNQLLEVRGVRKSMGAAADYTPTLIEQACVTQPEPTLDDARRALDIQGSEIEKRSGKSLWTE